MFCALGPIPQSSNPPSLNLETHSPGSPISGLFYLRGSLGGSIDNPSGAVTLRLEDGAVGRARLSRAVASAALSPEQVLTVDVEVAPADGPGVVRLNGTVPLPQADKQQQEQQLQGQQQQQQMEEERVQAEAPAARAAAAATDADAAPEGEAGSAPSAAGAPEGVDLSLLVRDGGVDLVGSLVPGFRWGGGSASVSLRVAGPLPAPRVTGNAALSRGVVHLDGLLRAPLTGVSGSLDLDGRVLRARGIEARSGRSGHIRLSGALPLRPMPPPPPASDGGAAEVPLPEGLLAEASALELRVRNAYSGLLDAAVRIGGSVAAPVVGGEVKLSKGTVYLVGQAGGAPGGAADSAVAGGGSARGSEAEMVTRAFSALKAGRRRAEDQVGGPLRNRGGRSEAHELCRRPCGWAR